MSRARALTLARSEAPFLAALLVAVAVRVLVQVAFPPGFVHSDGPAYLRFADHLWAPRDRPVGYGVLLNLLSHLSRGVDAITVLQHLLGLLAAAVVYVVLRRWSVPSWGAALAVLPLLLDQMQLVLEHSVLSDVLFELLLVLAVAALGWRRTPHLGAVAAAGLLLGAATLVRVVGEPAVLAGAVLCLAAAGSRWTRLRRVLVLAVCFVAPLTGYAAWYHQVHDVWALTQASSRNLYMRTTTFVDCARVSMPHYQRALCPREPVGERLDPTQYGWNYRERLPPLHRPRGVSRNEVLHDFAIRAVTAQPLDYARTVARDVALGFWPRRTDVYEYDTAHKWSFHGYLDGEPTAKAEVAFAEHGGQQPQVRQPVAGFLAAYDDIVYLPGPLLLALLAVVLAGLVVRTPPGGPESRPLIFLFAALGLGIAVVPDVVGEFVWRYQLPAIVLVPPAAALAWTRVRPRLHRDRPAPPPEPAPRPAAQRPDQAVAEPTPGRADV